MAIHSVSEVNRYIKELLGEEPLLRGLMIQGEISNFKRYPSGHCYFSLKDANAAIRCVMFRSRAQYLRFLPVNGLSVIASGSISVYERDGVYQFYVDSLTPQGQGDLALAFEQLKEKLTNEGLFNTELKQPLPRFPKKIGVVTSSAGAVLRDIYHVSKRRWPQIQLVLYPVQVQGEGAAEQIAAGIRFFNENYPVDTLIIGRGGGSMEDLWAFNEEIVVRAIYASQIPVISAVGHETDVTLSDFAADVRAATPSQAAELAVPDRQELLRYVHGLASNLQNLTVSRLQTKRQRLEQNLKQPLFVHPEMLLSERRERLDRALTKLQQSAEKQVQAKRHRTLLAIQHLDLLSPTNVLQHGYAMVQKEGKIVAHVQNLRAGDTVDLHLQDGTVPVRVLADGKEEKSCQEKSN